jgi:alpha-beta hydrolase superfamily lysophospholipase
VTSLADAFVSAGFRVVAMDAPGHGQSEGRQSSVVHFAKVIDAANRRYGPFRVVVAHSLGAAAATYELSRGLGCDSAVFFNPVVSYESVWRRSDELFQVSPKMMGLAAEHAGEVAGAYRSTTSSRRSWRQDCRVSCWSFMTSTIGSRRSPIARRWWSRGRTPWPDPVSSVRLL